jgi:SAM-dependent methyltransferase
MADGPSSNRRNHSLAFGDVAEVYSRARPGYPDALVDDVLELCDFSSPRVIEVGAGTGTATELFARHGLEILAIEPSAEMASIARSSCRRYPQVSVVVSTFEDWTAEHGAFDLLISAQAWHWVPSAVRYPKAYSVLRPKGALALFWSRPLWEQSELSEPLAAIYQTRAPELYGRGPWFPGFASTGEGPDGNFSPGSWPTGHQGTEIEASGLFGDVVERGYLWSLVHTADAYVDLLRTLPEHQALSEDRRDYLFAGIKETIEVWGGDFRMNYETRLFLSNRANS